MGYIYSYEFNDNALIVQNLKLASKNKNNFQAVGFIGRTKITSGCFWQDLLLCAQNYINRQYQLYLK